MERRKNSYSKYLEGWLNLQKSGLGNYQKYYCLARNRELHLFDSDREARIANAIAKDKIFLSNSASVNKESKPGKATFPTISVTFNSANLREIRIRALNSTQQDKWYRVLYALCLLKLPPDTQSMLPGQKQELLDIIEKEQQKPHQPQTDDYTPCFSPTQPKSPNRPSSIQTPPPLHPKHFTFQKRDGEPRNQRTTSSTSVTSKNWFVEGNVTREQSEKILDLNSEFGNLLLREREAGVDKCSLGISMKLKNSKFKHYLVREEVVGGRTQYVIQLSKQTHTPLYSMEDVVSYMMTEFPEDIRPLSKISHLPPELQGNEYEKAIPSIFKTHQPPVRSFSQAEIHAEKEEPYINDHELINRRYSNFNVEQKSATLPPRTSSLPRPEPPKVDRTNQPNVFPRNKLSLFN